MRSNFEYQLGLNRIINMSFTWFNVNPSYKNQTIAYSINNGSNVQDLTFPEGVWNYKDFDSYLKQIIKKNGISLTFNSTTFRVTIVLPAQVRLDLTKSDNLIGFDKKILTSGTHIGTKVPNLSQDTDVLNIHSDLIKLMVKIQPYEFKRFYHPRLGKFVYKHKGSGIIIDNIFKPMKAIASLVFKKVAKPMAKKSIRIRSITRW